METRILRCEEVCGRVSFSKATLYRLVRADQFPRPVRLTARLVGWRSTDIDQWIADAKSASAPAE